MADEQTLGGRLVADIYRLGAATLDPDIPSHAADLLSAKMITEMSAAQRAALIDALIVVEAQLAAGFSAIRRAAKPKLRVVTP